MAEAKERRRTSHPELRTLRRSDAASYKQSSDDLMQMRQRSMRLLPLRHSPVAASNGRSGTRQRVYQIVRAPDRGARKAGKAGFELTKRGLKKMGKGLRRRRRSTGSGGNHRRRSSSVPRNGHDKWDTRDTRSDGEEDSSTDDDEDAADLIIVDQEASLPRAPSESSSLASLALALFVANAVALTLRRLPFETALVLFDVVLVMAWVVGYDWLVRLQQLQARRGSLPRVAENDGCAAQALTSHSARGADPDDLERVSLQRSLERPDSGITDSTIKVCAALNWTEPPASSFNVRVGPDYGQHRKKASSGPAIYEPVEVRVFYAERNVVHASRALDIPAYVPPAGVTADERGLFGGLPGYMCLNIMIPDYTPSVLRPTVSGTGESVVCLFRLAPWAARAATSDGDSPPCIDLLRRWVEHGTETNEDGCRFKIIFRLANLDEMDEVLPTLVRSLATKFNAKPILSKPQHVFTRGDGYFEVGINVHEFMFTAKRGFASARAWIEEMVIDFAFLVEGRENDELPEAICGCVRLSGVELENAELWQFSTSS